MIERWCYASPLYNLLDIDFYTRVTYYSEFGRSRSNGVSISVGVPKKIGLEGLVLWDWRGWLTGRNTCLAHMLVKRNRNSGRTKIRR